MMNKILIYFGLIYTITALPQQLTYYGAPKSRERSPKSEVEVFFGKPLPLPNNPPKDPKSPNKHKGEAEDFTPANPTPKRPPKIPPLPTNVPKPFYPSKPSYPPTFYPKKPPPTTKTPSFFPWTYQYPSSPPKYPFSVPNNTPTFRPIYPTNHSRVFPTTRNTFTFSTTKRPLNPTKTTVFNAVPENTFPSSSTTATPKYSSPSGPSSTPAWIYPPRPSWPRKYHVVSNTQSFNVNKANIGNKNRVLPRFISEQRVESGGNIKLGFESPYGLPLEVDKRLRKE